MHMCTHTHIYARTHARKMSTCLHARTHAHTHTRTDSHRNQILSCLVRGDLVLAPPDKTRTVYADARMNAHVRGCMHACIHTNICWIGAAGLDRTVLHLHPLSEWFRVYV